MKDHCVTALNTPLVVYPRQLRGPAAVRRRHPAGNYAAASAWTSIRQLAGTESVGFREDMRMVEGRAGADAHELMCADDDSRHAGVIGEVGDNGFGHVQALPKRGTAIPAKQNAPDASAAGLRWTIGQTSINIGGSDDAIREGDLGDMTTARPARSELVVDGLPHRGDIDGLRAIAVLSVLAFHLNRALVPGGVVGVDIFFVLSGYLITAILLRDVNGGGLTVARFCVNRTRRIFPALFVMIWILLAAGFLMFAPWDFGELGRSTISVATFVANVQFWHESGYFAAGADTTPLLHAWSLSVEEQFYLLFPFYLWAMHRLNLLRAGVLLAVCVSFALSFVVARTNTSAAFYLLPMRAWELLLGSMVAGGMVPAVTTRRLRELAALAGLVLVVGSLWLLDSTADVPGVAVVLPCLGTVLLLHSGANGGQTTVARVLSSPVLRGIGLISYSLYLWHLPILGIITYRSMGGASPGQLAGVAAASIAVATLSWWVVERPFRSQYASADSFLGRTLLAARARVMVAALVLVGLTCAAGHLAFRLGSDAGWIAALYGREVAALVPSGLQHESDGRCRQSVAAEVGPDCRLGDPGKPASIAFWGDSFADAITPGLPDIDPDASAYQFVFHACPSILGTRRTSAAADADVFAAKCARFNAEVLERIRNSPEIRTVVLFNSYLYYVPIGDNPVQFPLEPAGEPGLAAAALRAKLVDAIAATAGPGLIGGVMVGLVTGKALAHAAGKPLIAVNHLEGHALSPRLSDPDLDFPYLLLLVSGGHCHLLLVAGVARYRRL
eukprot:gene19780-20257_t